MIQYPKLVILSTLFLIIGIFIGGGAVLWEEGFILKDSATRIPVSGSLVSEWRGTATGNIVEVKEQSVVIAAGQTLFEVPILAGTPVVLVTAGAPPKGMFQEQEGSLADMQVGDTMLAMLLFNTEGALKVEQVSVMRAEQEK